MFSISSATFWFKFDDYIRVAKVRQYFLVKNCMESYKHAEGATS
jgi:hypothetical protein